MTFYLVTGHDGAVDWAQRQGLETTRIAHLDPEILVAGDVVAGTLPAHLVADLGRRGVRYFHLVLDLDQDSRRRNLTADEMTALGARLEEIRAQSAPLPPAMAAGGPPGAGGTASAGAQNPPPAAGGIAAAGAFAIAAARCFDARMEAGAARLHTWFRKIAQQPGKAGSLRVLEAVVAAWALFALGSAVSGLPGAAVCLFTGPLEWAGSPFSECADDFGGRLLTLVVQLLFAAAFYFVGRWALMVTNEVAESRADLVEAQEARARVLITGLSPLRGSEEEIAASSLKTASSHAGQLQSFVDTVRNGAPNGGPWQQNARAIAHHLDRLERIYVLPSTKSRAQFDAFCAFCTTLFGRPMDIRLVRDSSGAEFQLPATAEGDARSYENYAYVHAGLSAALAQAKRDLPDLAEREVCIEATAGLKTFSIAAGILTLNRDVRFGYVTSHLEGELQGGEVRVYDARITFTGHLTDAAQGA